MPTMTPGPARRKCPRASPRRVGHAGKLGYLAFADWAERWLGDRNALPSPFELDTDGDNAVTLAELDAGMGRIFDRLDRDKDGYVTRTEALTIRTGVGRDGPAGRRRR